MSLARVPMVEKTTLLTAIRHVADSLTSADSHSLAFSPHYMATEGDFDLSGFFLNTDYQLQKVAIRETVVSYYALTAASTDFDLTGQVLWPAAIALSQYIADHQELVRGEDCLELGSGAGVLGLYVSGLARTVVLTDGQDVVMDLLRQNLQFALGNATCCKVDWTEGDPAISLEAADLPKQYKVLIGADIVHWPTLLSPLMRTVALLLAPDGYLLLGYTVRSLATSTLLEETVAEHHLTLTTLSQAGSNLILRIQHRGN